MGDSWKRFWEKCIFVSMFLLILAISAVYFVDPFFHYHMPLNNGPAVREKSIYVNPGIARNESYQAVITGSSVTENFRESWFEELFSYDTVKLPIGSGRTVNYRELFKNVFSSGNEIKCVFWGLDLFALVCDPEETIQEVPEYLYDNNLWNDVRYLLNKDVLLNEIPNVLFNQNSFNDDEAYTWDQRFEFGEEIAIEHYLYNTYNFSEDVEGRLPQDIYLGNCHDNLENVITFIRDNSNTEFYIFFPPYSMLYWHDKERRGETSAYLYAEEYAIQQLLVYENVKLFSFQDIEEIVCNLNNYKDDIHYMAEINYLMARSMKLNNYRITADNYKERLENLQNLIEHYKNEMLEEKLATL